MNNKLNLKRYFKKYLHFYVIAVIAVTCSITLDMIGPQIIRHIVDDVLIGKKIDMLKYCLLGILGVGICKCIFQYVKEFSCDWAGSKIASELRINLFQKIQSLSANFFDGINSGELMSRVKSDVDRIWDLGCYIGILMVEVVIHTVIALYFMFSLNWKLSIIPTIGMAVAAFIALKMERKLGDKFEKIAQEDSELNNTAQENLAGIRTVKAFTREKHEIFKFHKHNQKYYELNIDLSKVFVKYNPIISSVTHFIPYTVLLIGGFFTIQGMNNPSAEQFTIGELTAFLQYSMNIIWPMEMLGWLTNGISSARASAKRLEKIYEEDPSIVNKNDSVSPEINGNISFENVSFIAPNGKIILDNISFDIKKGETLGIMGATGSGKTTIINLLKRMYDATSGKIYIDGIDIKDINLNTLRSNISSVMQDIFLFSDTIGSNVKLGKKEFLDNQNLCEALEQSCSSSFVNGMKEKSETVIGERGIGLSGGQKQRLTIARAISRKTPVLIFDDSTSALDTETEQEIQKNLDSLKGMTKIIIAHRISAVRKADKIIVLENGKIVESGNNDELLAKKGLYYETYKSQY